MLPTHALPTRRVAPLAVLLALAAMFFSACDIRLVRRGSPKRSAKAAKAAKKKRPLSQSKRRQWQLAHSEARTARRAVWRSLDETGVASSEAIEALTKASETMRQLAPTRVAWWDQEARRISAFRTLRTPDANAVAAAFDGTVLKSTRVKSGKRHTLRFTVAPQHCYLALGSLEPSNLPMKLQASLDAGKQESKLLRFELAPRPWSVSKGACVYGKRSVKLSFKADVESVSKKPGFNLVVVQWSRDAFPAWLAADLHRELPDRCDPDSYDRLWKTPVPGGLAFLGGRPVYLLTPPDGGFVSAYFLGTKEHPTPIRSLTHTRPTGTRFDVPITPAKVEHCSVHTPLKVARRFAKCDHGLFKRYDHRIEMLYQDGGKYNTRLADRLQEDWDAAFATRCEPLREKVRATLSTRYAALVESVASGKRPDDVDIVSLWQDW